MTADVDKVNEVSSRWVRRMRTVLTELLESFDEEV